MDVEDSISESRKSTRNHKAHLICVTLLVATALLGRGGILLAMRGNLEKDSDAYRLLAKNLRQFEVFGTNLVSAEDGRRVPQPTAYRPPLYPMMLAYSCRTEEISANDVATAHLALGLFTVLCVYLCGIQLKLGPIFSMVAGMLAAVDPILLNQSTLVMTETLATYLVISALIALILLQKSASIRRAILAGVFIGLACLCRPSFLPWAVLTVLAIFVVPAFDGVRLKIASALSVAVAAVLTPWIVRNWHVMESPIVATTHGGYTLLLGNNPGFYDFLKQPSHRRADVWDSKELDDRYAEKLNEFDNDELMTNRWAYDQAKANILEDNDGFSNACLVRIGRLWRLVPHRVGAGEATLPRLLRYAVGFWYAHVFAAALIGVIVLRRKLFGGLWLWGMLLCASLTIVHLFYWSNMRMRAPLMPFVCLIAAAGLAGIYKGWRKRATVPDSIGDDKGPGDDEQE